MVKINVNSENAQPILACVTDKRSGRCEPMLTKPCKRCYNPFVDQINKVSAALRICNPFSPR
jgi:hypothetical protein